MIYIPNPNPPLLFLLAACQFLHKIRRLQLIYEARRQTTPRTAHNLCANRLPNVTNKRDSTMSNGEGHLLEQAELLKWCGEHGCQILQNLKRCCLRPEGRFSARVPCRLHWCASHGAPTAVTASP